MSPDEDLLAVLPPVTAESPAIHRVGDYAIHLLTAARELNDPELIWLAEQIAIAAGRKIARDMISH